MTAAWLAHVATARACVACLIPLLPSRVRPAAAWCGHAAPRRSARSAGAGHLRGVNATACAWPRPGLAASVKDCDGPMGGAASARLPWNHGADGSTPAQATRSLPREQLHDRDTQTEPRRCKAANQFTIGRPSAPPINTTRPALAGKPMTTFKTICRVSWLAAMATAQFIWAHRAEIRAAVIRIIAGCILAAQLAYQAGCWTRRMVEALNERSADLLPGQPLPADRKSTRLNSSHVSESRMPSSA